MPSDLEDFQELKVKDFRFNKFYNRVKTMETPKIFLILPDDAKKFFKKMKKPMEMIRAAGGLVHNEENKYLFIFRKGKWDLPKGKLDKGESYRSAAVREVEEECGIRVDKCGSRISKTYHIYEMFNVPVIKKTVWYTMRADNQPDLKPQTEEDITDAKWLAAGDFMMVKQNTYPLIRDVIAFVEA